MKNIASQNYQHREEMCRPHLQEYCAKSITGKCKRLRKDSLSLQKIEIT